MKKRYIINGFLTYRLLLKDDKGYKACVFENGAVSGICSRPASFTTADLKMQSLIEKSDEFKKGVIKLSDVEEVKEETFSDLNTFPDVTNIQSARAVLNEMGVPIEALQTKAAVIKQAEEKGVKFPNWK